MAMQQRAIIVTDERRNNQTVRDLRTVLIKSGYKDTLCTTQIIDIANVVYASQLPVIFIDHDSAGTDGLRQFERIFRSPGNQLFHYILIVDNDEKVMSKSFKSLGFAAVIHKPFQAQEVSEALTNAFTRITATSLKSVHDYALAMLNKDYFAAEIQLKTLRQDHKFKNKAEIARAFLNDIQGAGPKVMAIFQRLAKDDSVDLRTLSDYAFFLKKFSIYDECKTTHERIREKQPNLLVKIWEEILFLSELEYLNDIAILLEKIDAFETQRDNVVSLLARMMQVLCLGDKIPQLLTQKASDYSAYQEFVKREAEKEREKQAKAAAQAAAAQAATQTAPQNTDLLKLNL